MHTTRYYWCVGCVWSLQTAAETVQLQRWRAAIRTLLTERRKNQRNEIKQPLCRESLQSSQAWRGVTDLEVTVSGRSITCSQPHSAPSPVTPQSFTLLNDRWALQIWNNKRGRQGHENAISLQGGTRSHSRTVPLTFERFLYIKSVRDVPSRTGVCEQNI